MALTAFLAVCAGGAALGQMTGTFRRLGPLVTLAGLAAACTTALLIGPTDGVTVGEVRLSGSTYTSAFLAVAVAACLLLWLVRLGSGGRSDRLAPATMAVFGGLGIALTAADAGVALTAVAAAAVAGTAVSVGGGNASEGSDNRLSEARTMALLVASLLFASIAVSRPAWTDQDGPVFVLGLLGLAAALAVRSGSVPFHVPAARLAKSGPSMAPALLLVWIPAGLGLLAVSWSTTTFGLRSDALAATVTAIQIVAVATLILGAVGALLHDDLTEIAVYSIVGDSGFILLALASRNAGAAEPARLWLLAFLAAKTGFVAWAVAASHAFGSANLGELYGWLRRTPILGLALIAIAAATLGWPGSPVYEARSTLIEVALPGSFGFLGAAVIALALLCYGRLLLVGLLTPSETVRAAAGERPRWSQARPPVAADITAEVTAEAAAPATAASKPRKRTSRAAAAAEPLPASTAPPASPPDEAATAPESPAGPGWRDRLVLTWGLNGTLRVSFAVLAAAALSLTLALGGLGASNASRVGIPFDAAANSTPRPTPSPTPAPTPSPEPTFAPIGSHNPGTSGGPGASNSPGGSGGPSSSPSGSGGPTRSSVPAPLPIR